MEQKVQYTVCVSIEPNNMWCKQLWEYCFSHRGRKQYNQLLNFMDANDAARSIASFMCDASTPWSMTNAQLSETQGDKKKAIIWNSWPSFELFLPLIITILYKLSPLYFHFGEKIIADMLQIWIKQKFRQKHSIS